MKKSVIITIVSLVLVIIGLSVTVFIQHSRIRDFRQQIADNAKVIEYLTDRNERLSEINGISVSVEFTLKQSNVFSASNNNLQNVAKEICQLTRGEILDSLQNNNVQPAEPQQQQGKKGRKNK